MDLAELDERYKFPVQINSLYFPSGIEPGTALVVSCELRDFIRPPFSVFARRAGQFYPDLVLILNIIK